MNNMTIDLGEMLPRQEQIDRLYDVCSESYTYLKFHKSYRHIIIRKKNHSFIRYTQMYITTEDSMIQKNPNEEKHEEKQSYLEVVFYFPQRIRSSNDTSTSWTVPIDTEQRTMLKMTNRFKQLVNRRMNLLGVDSKEIVVFSRRQTAGY